jgi:glycosyltransferase involved in cell wall biosynthesis
VRAGARFTLTRAFGAALPLISIVLAYRNTAEYLPACIDSIRAQTHTHWELIAVNDHSTDGADELLKSYAQKDKRIRCFDSPGQRLNPALIEAQRHIRGLLINRMDSDDIMPLDKLSSMLAVWEKHGRGHVVAGGTKHFSDDGLVGDGFRRYDAWLNVVARENRHLEEIYKECVIPSHCWLIHREDFEGIGGFSDVYPEDYDLTFRMYRGGLQIVGIDKVLHHWRDRSDRISRTWEEYKDNRYFELKLPYFLELDRDSSRPLVLWGAGRNGKDMAKLLLARAEPFHWVCDNPRKIGEDVYGVIIESIDQVQQMNEPQVMVVVSSPDAIASIKGMLSSWGKKPRLDYWFFA